MTYRRMQHFTSEPERLDSLKQEVASFFREEQVALGEMKIDSW